MRSLGINFLIYKMRIPLLPCRAVRKTQKLIVSLELEPIPSHSSQPAAAPAGPMQDKGAHRVAVRLRGLRGHAGRAEEAPHAGTGSTAPAQHLWGVGVTQRNRTSHQSPPGLPHSRANALCSAMASEVQVLHILPRKTRLVFYRV